MNALLATLILAALACAAAEVPAKPTFAKDIAPVLYERCAHCHRPGDIGPMPLLTYAQVRPWSAAIKQSVQLRRMPPWFADPHYSKFRNDRRLTDAQVEMVVAWVNAGSPKGDEKDMPPLPQFTDGWSFQRPPDLVVEMPVEVKVQAKGVLDLQNYYIKVPFQKETFVEAVELRPGNRRVVHHSIVNIVEIPEAVEPKDLVTGAKRGRILWKLIGQAPGKGAESHWPGVAKRIQPGTYFEFNMHYTPTGKEETDRTKLGIWFSKEPIHHEVVTAIAANEIYREGKLIKSSEIPNIPAHTDNWPIVGVMRVKDDITVYSVSPHMHFRGKNMKYSVKYPDGRDEVLLDVPKYNYEWQLNYEFANPPKIPAGSVITVRAHYDNSANNPKNPSPEQEVVWGQQSWNEMFIPWIEYSIDKNDLLAAPRTVR